MGGQRGVDDILVYKNMTVCDVPIKPGTKVVFQTEWNKRNRKYEAFNVMEDDQTWRLHSTEDGDFVPERGGHTVEDSEWGSRHCINDDAFTLHRNNKGKGRDRNHENHNRDRHYDDRNRDRDYHSRQNDRYNDRNKGSGKDHDRSKGSGKGSKSSKDNETAICSVHGSSL